MEFLTSKDYPWLCPVCKAVLDQLVTDVLPEAEDTDDAEWACNFMYDHRLFCHGDHCNESDGARGELEAREFMAWLKDREAEEWNEYLHRGEVQS